MGCGASSTAAVAAPATTLTNEPTKQQQQPASEAPPNQPSNDAAVNTKQVVPISSEQISPSDQPTHESKSHEDARREQHEKNAENLGKASHVLEVGSTITEGLLGGLATANDDGTYTAKDCLPGGIDLSSPVLKDLAGKLIFGLSEVAKTFQAGKVVCLILEACYKMYNSSANKTRWTNEFMCYLKLVEAEVTLGRNEFQSQGFLLQIEKELTTTQQRLEIILGRSSVASFVFSMTDESTLQESKLTIEGLKKEALQGMMIEIKQDTAKTNSMLKSMIDDLKKKQSEGFKSSSPVEQELLRSMKQLEEDNKLKGLFGLLENCAEISSRTKEFQPGSRREILDEFKEWIKYVKKPTSTAASSDASSSPSDMQPFSESTDRVFWIAAGVGMGKTSLAAYLTSSYTNSILATNFCFMPLALDDSLISSPRNDPFMITKSIVFQLSQRIPAYRAWLVAYINANTENVVEKLQSNIYTKKSAPHRFPSLKKMAEELLVKPLFTLNANYNKTGDDSGLPSCIFKGQDLVIVKEDQAPKGEEGKQLEPLQVDASQSFASNSSKQQIEVIRTEPQKVVILIDSIEQAYFTPQVKKEDDFIQVLLDLSPKLPQWIGLVLTSRLEDRIMEGLGSKYKPHLIDPLGEMNQRDLQLFLSANLPPLLESPERLDEYLPQLLQQSGGLWIYLSKLLYPFGRDSRAPNSKLKPDRLSNTHPDELCDYCWYPMLQHLKQSFEHDDTKLDGITWESHVLPVFKAVFQHKEMCISLSELSTATQLTPDLLCTILIRSRSLLPELKRPDSPCHIVPIHPSLRAWMTDPVRQHQSEEVDFFIQL